MDGRRLALAGVLVLTGGVRAADGPANETIDARLLALHRDEAKRWEIFVDPALTERAEFVPEPIFRWTNPSRDNGQTGAMFVWTFRGRPVAMGGVFSNPARGRRVIMHELHALGPLRIYPREKGSGQEWLPAAAVPLLPLPDAPPPEATPRRRELQARELARRFTARTVDMRGNRWQLRLLSRPLYRYQSAEGGSVEGTVFAFVSDAGTDPEIILVLEAVDDGGKRSWRYRAVRFSISNLYVQYQGQEVWTSLRDDPKAPFGGPADTYRLIRDRLIDELPELDSRRNDKP